MKKLTIGVVALSVAVMADAADSYYVNAKTGLDAYDGKAAVWDGFHGPKRLLSDVSALVTPTTDAAMVGDTVYVAEGDYNEGSDESGLFRAAFPAGTRLVGVGDRDKIRIFGSATGKTRSTSASDLRCLSMGSWTLVENMTLCNGRGHEVDGGACKGTTSTYYVGCVFSNNYASATSASKQGKGGAVANGTVIRCLFKRNSAFAGRCMYSGTAWNCVFDQTGENSSQSSDYVTYNTKTYNCTVAGTGGCGVRGGSHYNLLLRRPDGGKSGSGTSMYSALYVGESTRGNANDARTLVELGEAKLRLDGDYTPVKTSDPVNAAIDYGSNVVYETDFPTSDLVADQKYLDFNGNGRIKNGVIDVGACESDPLIRRLVITDAQTGLTIVGAPVGETVLGPGESVTLTLSRNYSTAKLCVGVRVNGEFLSFTGETEDLTYQRTYAYGDPAESLTIEAVYAQKNDWYVDALKGDNANNGYTKYQAKRTLVGAMTNALLSAGDTVHAAEGVYDEGEMRLSGGTSNRVHVVEGVGLVADGSVGKTIIKGFIPDVPGKGDATSVRCVTLSDGAYVKGFTICNGSTALEGSAERCVSGKGGGVQGGTVIDCVITNCYAVRGGGASAATLIRCRVVDCGFVTGTNPYGKTADPAAAGTIDCSLYDSFSNGEVYDPDAVINSTIDAKMTKSTGMLRVCNSCVDQVSERSEATVLLSNCVYRTGGATDVATSVKVDKLPAVDAATLRPVADAASLLIDKGVNADHVYPADFADELGTDVGGGQRTYNGRIDIGCGEFDWRGTYAQAFGARRVLVAAASENVTNAVDCVVLQDGDALTLTYDLRVAGPCSIDVELEGEGAVAVTARGVVLTPTTNTYAFDGVAGLNSVRIAFEGSGSARVKNPKLASSGLILLFR